MQLAYTPILPGLEPAPQPHAAVQDLIDSVASAQFALYARTAATAPWIGYFAQDAATGEVLGSCSFVGPPREHGVEIAYFTFPHAEGRGLATQMATMLVELARQNGASFVLAHTLPEESASTRILQRLRFVIEGESIDEDAGRVWRWRLNL